MNEATPSLELNKKVHFRGQILNQIYRVWLFRKLFPTLVIEIITLSLVLYQLGKIIFVQKVVQNALNVLFIHPPQIISFSITAFTHASLTTKILGAVAALLIAFLIRHISQGLLRLILVKENYFGKLEK